MCICVYILLHITYNVFYCVYNSYPKCLHRLASEMKTYPCCMLSCTVIPAMQDKHSADLSRLLKASNLQRWRSTTLSSQHFIATLLTRLITKTTKHPRKTSLGTFGQKPPVRSAQTPVEPLRWRSRWCSKSRSWMWSWWSSHWSRWSQWSRCRYWSWTQRSLMHLAMGPICKYGLGGS